MLTVFVVAVINEGHNIHNLNIHKYFQHMQEFFIVIVVVVVLVAVAFV